MDGRDKPRHTESESIQDVGERFRAGCFFIRHWFDEEPRGEVASDET